MQCKTGVTSLFGYHTWILCSKTDVDITSKLLPTPYPKMPGPEWARNPLDILTYCEAIWNGSRSESHRKSFQKRWAPNSVWYSRAWAMSFPVCQSALSGALAARASSNFFWMLSVVAFFSACILSFSSWYGLLPPCFCRLRPSWQVGSSLWNMEMLNSLNVLNICLPPFTTLCDFELLHHRRSLHQDCNMSCQPNIVNPKPSRYKSPIQSLRHQQQLSVLAAPCTENQKFRTLWLLQPLTTSGVPKTISQQVSGMCSAKNRWNQHCPTFAKSLLKAVSGFRVVHFRPFLWLHDGCIYTIRSKKTRCTA